LRYPVGKLLLILGILSTLITFNNCSTGKFTLRLAANVLGSGTSTAFTEDDDVDLVLESLPFTIKSMESLLKEVPEHKGLCHSLTKGYMLYTYGRVETQIENFRDTDFSKYKSTRQRARKLYKRAYDYGMRSLYLVHSDFKQKYDDDHQAALELISKKEDVSLLYWTGAALAKWISFSKTDPEVIVNLPSVKEFMLRALHIDSTFDGGAIYELMVSYEHIAGDSSKAMEHYHQAAKISEGKKASVYLTYAKTFSISNHNAKEFDEYIKKVMDMDINKYPEYKLANAISKQKAELLAAKKDDLFLGE